MGLVGFFLLAGQDVSIGWIGLDSLIIIVVYAGGVRLIQNQGGKPPTELPPDDRKIPSLRMAVLGFTFITIILVIVTPSLVESADQIATLTGLNTGFIGATLLAFVTSLPEVVATVAAVRIGAFDLAVGNLFGSNLFNMFAVGFVDVLYFDGLFLSVIDQRFAVVGLLGLVLTCLGLIGNIARVERRLLFVELDAFLILMVYFLGMWFLYSQGVGV
jgi:cation:H+ antiporter